ncbi:hypothetical protein CDQ84_03900 [Clostridium thermosuccinogenes]|uniref:Probable zinc-binding domain-containing protein n=1 Tax=Clostridium thermosuccinogenes TaxID=84032 RepID=A0A2K2EWM2_9CLOT|nr:zinc-ribbon domain-containing protein [Pseudoclostridium thermosuccinogenes]AUS98433.1 hypothetical protein CDO33_19405 [Pseudoclostridium thermosuccinogenes]PNT90918.1 hypothetical protein CDQ83_13880 [Pseudoclostridium thermosuccinogenes]PNT98887.1 hypothetical protein CDQ85_03855 [Pseudoclostridium thermosuccinogenes]PNU00802.1 hypothetical protein CDQ84_03900 [Pseudoclostridium thermosuccinogenes]
MPDKILVCKDCNAEFVFTEGEQEFYKERNFQNEPQRCAACRRVKKQQRRFGGNFGFAAGRSGTGNFGGR